MYPESSYGIGFFLGGNFHILCHDGTEYRFHIIKPHTNLEPVELDYYDARKFIETHPVCTNLSHHEVRIMPFSEIKDLLEGKSPPSAVRSLLIGEEEEEERLH